MRTFAKKILASVMTLAAFVLMACMDINTGEREAVASAYLKVNGSTERTVTPDYGIDGMTDFVLMGEKTENTGFECLATFENYAALLQATIPIEQGNWYRLMLTAYEERTAFSATAYDFTVQAGTNTIVFELMPDMESTSASTGIIRVTFVMPNAVHGVKAGLFDRSTDNELSDYVLEPLVLEPTVDGANAVYEAWVISGTYRLKAFFYADEGHTAIVSTYSELVRVVAGNTSSAERVISMLNDSYTITEELDGGGYAEGYTPATIYTRYSGLVALPTVDEMEKEGYFFDGWYTTDDYTGERVTEISSKREEDVTLYAKWIQGCIVRNADVFSDKSSYGDTYMIRLLGEWLDLRQFGDELSRVSDKHITLDMTHTIGVTGISNDAFSGCSSLVSIELPEGVERIGNSAFENCSSLASIELPDSVTSIDGSAFSGCSSLVSISIVGNVGSIGSYAFNGCSSLASIELPEGVERIGNSAFENCSLLESVSIVGNVGSIDSCAFIDCSLLESVSIIGNVGSISNSAFSGCSLLESISIVGNVGSIGDSAFSGCSSLVSIELPKGVERIGNSAFGGCSLLESISIVGNVGSIGDYAFYGCSSLESISIVGNVGSIGSYAFSDCSSLVSIELPKGVKHIGNSAFSGCSLLESISIVGNVGSIGDYAFSGCSSLVSIELPEGLERIGDYAFEGCISLETITFTGTREQWNVISKGSFWHSGVPTEKVICIGDNSEAVL